LNGNVRMSQFIFHIGSFSYSHIFSVSVVVIIYSRCP
jgi:hypothetical protein